MLSTSPEVAVFKPRKFKDGRPPKFPDLVEGDRYAVCGYKRFIGPHSIEATMEHVIVDPNNYDWNHIKKKWDRNWHFNYPTATIRVQKTPLDVFRVKLIQPYFENLNWVISVKNPLAHVTSIIDRSTFQMNPYQHIEMICYHAGRALEVQRENIEFLGSKALVTTQEEIISNPEQFKSDLLNFVPELKSLTIDTVTVKGKTGPIINKSTLDTAKLLYKDHPQLIHQAMEYLKPFREATSFWGYDLDESYAEIIA
jgi:hypothetical protein